MSCIVLIRPPLVMPYSAVTTSLGVPPIGIAYLASSLKKAGHQVRVIDSFGEAVDKFTPYRDSGTRSTNLGHSRLFINGLTKKEIVKRIPDDTEIIGVSCMYSNEWLYSKLVIKTIIKKFPSLPLILGGEHITALPEYVLKTCPGIHCCVLGEGEETIIEVVNAIKKKKSLKNIAGIAFIDPNGDFVKTRTRARINKIDKIPWPSWEEIPLENYLKRGFGMGATGGRNMPMIATRGCPYQCAFCSNKLMWQRKWVARNPKKVFEEMKSYVKRFKITHIEFYDQTAILRKAWIMKFTKLLIAGKLGVTWALPSGTRSEALDRPVLKRLYDSGCHELTYSPESGSPLTLKRVKKQINLRKMLRSMRWAVKNHLVVKANIVIGFPGQTKKEIMETFWFILKMAWVGIHDVAVFPFVPYPGSQLYLQLLKKRQIPARGREYENFLTENIYNDVLGMKSWSEHISNRLLKFFSLGGMVWFYTWQFIFRPQRAISACYRLARRKPRTMFERAVQGLLRSFSLRNRLK